MTQKVQKYICLKCDYSSNNFAHYNRHINTIKHKMITNDGKSTSKKHICDCGKEYTYRQGLYNHKKQCEYILSIQNQSSKSQPKHPKMTQNNPEMIPKKLAYTCEYCGNTLSKKCHLHRHYSTCKMKKKEEDLQHQVKKENEFLKQQLEKKDEQLEKKDEQIKELIPKVGNVTNNFNFNNFLNEQCKDAITIEAFVESIKISLTQLLLTQKEGVTSGISNLITENMNKLAINERPIHCSDKKREVLYVKNDTWNKDSDKKHTKHMIDTLCTKQLKSVKSLIENNDGDYANIISKCTSNVNEKKVMKNICDSVYVNEV